MMHNLVCTCISCWLVHGCWRVHGFWNSVREGCLQSLSYQHTSISSWVDPCVLEWRHLTCLQQGTLSYHLDRLRQGASIL
jgi:hypothetical protein